MKTGQRWETRPLESWAKAKEMRARFEKAVRTAEQEKVLLAQGEPPLSGPSLFRLSAW